MPTYRMSLVRLIHKLEDTARNREERRTLLKAQHDASTDPLERLEVNHVMSCHYSVAQACYALAHDAREALRAADDMEIAEAHSNWVTMNATLGQHPEGTSYDDAPLPLPDVIHVQVIPLGEPPDYDTLDREGHDEPRRPSRELTPQRMGLTRKGGTRKARK